jgi:transposase
MLDQIAMLTEQIQGFDQRIEHMAESKYPETKVLRGVKGVGALTAMSFVTVGDAKRFRKSRDVGCYLGLRPRRSQSGERDPQLGITKAGNRPLRATLVQCAQYVLGPFGPDSALRRWGLTLAQRGGKNAKKRASVAVARKLAVLLHRLWVTQKPYEPFYGLPTGAVPATR